MANVDTFVNLGMPRCQKVLPLAYDDSLSYYEAICKMTNKVNEIVDFIQEYEDTANALLEALNTTIPDFNTRLTKIENEFAGLDDIKAQLENLTKQHTNDILALQTQLDNINVDFKAWNKKIEDVYSYIETELSKMERDYNYQFYKLRHDMNIIKAELENKMAEITTRIEYLIEHITVDIYNPVQGKRVTFDKNNRYVYDDLNNSAATCGEIVARKITVQQVIDGNWTFRQWATKSRELITRYFNHGYSPVSGKFTNWGNAISELLGIHFASMTCDEISAKDIPCSYFTENGLTVMDVIKLKLD